MKCRVIPSKRFIKTLRKYAKGGNKKVIQAAEEVIDLLAMHDQRSLYVLGTRWQDHALKGNKRGIRELHLSMDDLLLYCLDEDHALIELLDIISHEKLRKM